MARHRTLRGGAFPSLASASSFVKGRLAKAGLFTTPGFQAAATASKDAKALVAPPAAVPVAKAVAPAVVAQAVPVATPVAAPAPAKLSARDAHLASQILWANDSGVPFIQNSLAPRIAESAVSVKNKERNLALLSGVGELAKEVKALHDEGVPMTVSRDSIKNPGTVQEFDVFEEFESLADPAVRTRIAQALVSAQDPPGKPNERRFLPSTINQIASAVRMAFQKKLLLGGRKTRRGRKVRRQTRRRV